MLNIFIKKKIKKYKNKKKYIPCILYNKNYNLPCYISLLEVNKILLKKEYIINIFYKKKKNISLIKDIQYNVFRNKILHIDFYKIENKNIEFITYVNIKFIGNSIGVFKGAICNIVLKKIKIKTTLKNYPKYFNIDISKLDIGNKIYIKDILYLKKNIKILHPYDQVIVSIKMIKIKKEKENKDKDKDKKKENKDKDKDKKKENKDKDKKNKNKK
ncbi:MAG: 50S ribosomal protein L25 [Candidatus Shikimatogenerans bostrichidophilus]|nr:MAG: 50S ribosomal protein L25 [Candidatus Shikimatogenerans bostrichidophilus]